jgi:hypothetical protein
MNIPWKLKSTIFSLIDRFNVNAFLYFLQKNVTKHSRITNIEIDETWVSHYSALIENVCTGFMFEFGAGKSLSQNIFLSNLVNYQLVVDLNPMIDLKLVNQSRSLLSNKVNLRSRTEIKFLGSLLKLSH